jgi:hypothetical protein
VREFKNVHLRSSQRQQHEDVVDALDEDTMEAETENRERIEMAYLSS